MAADYYEYMREYAPELGARIVETYAPIHAVGDPVSPHLGTLLRDPLPAQTLAIMGISKYLRDHRSAKIVAECGTGKTLMSIGACHVHADGKPYSALVMCPPHLVMKWVREVLITVPGARTFIIEDLRNGGAKNKAHGVVEARLEGGKVVRRGLATSLPALRHKGRKQWLTEHPRPTFFIMGKEKGKLGYFWTPAYTIARSGPANGRVINPDTGLQIERSGSSGYVTALDFAERDIKRFQTITRPAAGNRTVACRSGFTATAGKPGSASSAYSALWQADRKKIQRMAPLDYMGRYMLDWWTYSIADEVHQLAGDTAQGNGLAVLARVAKRLITLTGTLLSGYADDLHGIISRCDAPLLARDGYPFGSSGRHEFQRQYGVIETVEKVTSEDNRCSRSSKKSVQLIRRPGCSPMLFGKYLMESTAFVSLEDISDSLPAFEEEVIQVEADGALKAAYKEVADDIKDAIKDYPLEKGLRSIMLHTLLSYPDHPFGWKPIHAQVTPRGGRRQTILVSDPPNLSEDYLYPKEKELLEDIQEELRQGRRCQVFCVYTNKHDTSARLESILRKAGIRAAVLRSSVPTEEREAWYERRLQEGVQVVIGHPKLVETGLDLLMFPTLYFYQTGYSLHTLRQASRRSWRIGQRNVVRVKYFAYKNTMQENCIRLMGKKMLVALMMEGKFSGEGLQSLDADEDMLTAMVRELVNDKGIGETADAIWRDIERERAKQLGPRPAATELPAMPMPVPADPTTLDFDAPVPAPPEPDVAAIPLAAPPPLPVTAPATAGLHLIFSTPTPKLQRKATVRRVESTNQLSLFAAA